MPERRLILAATAIALVLPSLAIHAQTGDGSFDHRYAAWDALLKKHVRWLADGNLPNADNGKLLRQGETEEFMAGDLDFRGPLSQIVFARVGGVNVTVECSYFD